MKDFWNKRYAGEEYAYGTSPNEFLKSELGKILNPGRILFPAEGEGRNAVYAASLGWDVVAFDVSEMGMEKALRLAEKNKVTIEYLLQGYQTINLPQESFDVIGLFFAHMPSELRAQYHQNLSGFLKPGGKIIMEAFSEYQLGRSSGGPQNIAMLFSKEKLEHDFRSLKNLSIKETERELSEGGSHKGMASLIQLTAEKYKPRASLNPAKGGKQ